MSEIKKIGIMTAGGDCPGLNAVIRAIVKTAKKKLLMIEELGCAHFPICIAKTQYSFSTNPKLVNVPKDFELHVQDVVINAGAEMLVIVCGKFIAVNCVWLAKALSPIASCFL